MKTYKIALPLLVLVSSLGLLSCHEDIVRQTMVSVAVDTTQSVIARSSTKAMVRGVVTEVVKSKLITEHGHCWAIYPNPEFSSRDSTTKKGPKPAKGEFISELTNLQPNKKYFVRAYVLVDNQVYYSRNQISFTTLPGISEKEIAAVKVSHITASTAEVRSDIDIAGTQTVSGYGHCWTSVDALTPTLTQNEGISNLGTQVFADSFSTTLSDLKPATNYYVRAYIVTNTDTIYGPKPDKPTFRTASD